MSQLTARRMARVLLSAFFLVPLRVAANPPKVAVPVCLMSMSEVPTPLRFQDYPATFQADIPPKAPVLATSDAFKFRSALRDASNNGPNFAGHYTVAVWGCGSSCSDFAIIDARSGKVFFDQSLRSISGVHVIGDPNGDQADFTLLRFRPDSRLFIILSAPGEEKTRDGVAFYEWTGSEFKLLRFVPRSEACKLYP